MYLNELNKTSQGRRTSNVLRSSMVSIPKTITSSITPQEMDAEVALLNDDFRLSGSSFFEILNKQHPIMHTWLLLSSCLICCLSALLFIIPR